MVRVSSLLVIGPAVLAFAGCGSEPQQGRAVPLLKVTLAAIPREPHYREAEFEFVVRNSSAKSLLVCKHPAAVWLEVRDAKGKPVEYKLADGVAYAQLTIGDWVVLHPQEAITTRITRNVNTNASGAYSVAAVYDPKGGDIIRPALKAQLQQFFKDGSVAWPRATQIRSNSTPLRL
jgi:hypothetical protein